MHRVRRGGGAGGRARGVAGLLRAPVHDTLVSPAVAPYRPGGQGTPAGVDMPPTHMLPAGARQGPVHAPEVAPVVDPYRPTSHGEQLAEHPLLNRPAPHTTAVPLVDPAGHTYPGAQQPEHCGVMDPGLDPK